MDYTKTDDNLKGRIEEYIHSHLKDTRLQHTYRVVTEALKLAKEHGEDVEKTEIAALLHDCAKNLPMDKMNDLIRELDLDSHYINNSNLSHSKLAAWVAETEFGIDDKDILNAISYHTTGREGMSELEKVIFLADAIEPGRTYTGVEDIRQLAWDEKNMDKACLRSLENTVHFVNAKGDYLDPDTLHARDWLRQEIDKES